MRTFTTVKLVDNLTPAEYQACRSLTLRQSGQMWYDLYNYKHGIYHGTKVKFRRADKPCKVVLIKSETGELLAWALMSPEINKSADYLAQFYVRASHRGKGLGSRLMKQCLKIDPNPWVIPFSGEAAGLFKKYKSAVRYDNKQKAYQEFMQ